MSKAASREVANRSADYFCACCGTKALRTNGALLSELPTRGTDSATVVDEAEQPSQTVCPSVRPSARPPVTATLLAWSPRPTRTLTVSAVESQSQPQP